ncbi:hypothetical protein ABEF91_001591 [Exophiala dermatitidis]
MSAEKDAAVMAKPVSVDAHVPVTSVPGAAPEPVNTVQQDNEPVEESNELALMPYNIITVEKKQPVPTSYFSNTLSAIGLANVTGHLIMLHVNIASAKSAGHENLLPAKCFAYAQSFECVSVIAESLWRLTVSFIRNPVPRPTYRILGDNVPGVDLIVVACGEPVDIVLDTVNAACHVDWPVDKLRVILADDGDDKSLRAEVKALCKKHPNLHYFARYKPDGVHHGYKAGNLNATLKWVQNKLPGGRHEFMAVLDADMIPEPCILRALVPHALKSPNIGMVTTAQHFYNIPDNDPLYQANVTGTGADDGFRDSVGAAWCPGSGFVLRTRAWVSMGGFPEFTITEDLMTSWFLHGLGWQIALCHEILQWGIQPDCLLTHLKQRRRWWTGHVRDAFRTNFSLSDPRLEQATAVQRIAMFHHCCRPYLNTLFKAFSMILMAMALYFQGQIIATPSENTLWNMMMSCFLAKFLTKVSDWRGARALSHWNLRRRHATNTWLGIHFARDVFFSALPKSIGGLRLGFDVTGVADNQQPVKERDAERRPRLLTRLWQMHKQEGILYHACLAFVMVYLMYRAVKVEIDLSTYGGAIIVDDDFWRRILTGVGYPGLNLIEVVPLFLTPVVYAIFPPTMPPRRARMMKDEDGVWRPREDCKGIKWTKASFWLEIPHALGLIWTVTAYFILRHLQG